MADGVHGLLVHCFAGCSSTDILAALRDRSLRDRHHHADVLPGRVKSISKQTGIDIWTAALPLSGTLAETYLTKHRCLTPPFPPTLRFSPSLVYPPMGRPLPALIAAVQAPDRLVIAVQATFLRAADGAKAPLSSPRWTFGKLRDGAVRLAKAERMLGLAEGIEDALAAMELTGCQCWASLGSERLASVQVPAGVDELHIFCDRDEAGRRGAEKASDHHRRLGRTVVLHIPPLPHKDWGDVAADRSNSRRSAAA